MSTCDSYTQNPCIPVADQTYDSSTDASGNLIHTKDREWLATFQGFSIIFNKRQRNFNLMYTDNNTLTVDKFIPVDSGGYAACGVDSGSHSASVSEDATFIDSEVYFLDPNIGVCFYKERTETCSFSKTSSQMVAFKEVWGMRYYHKLIVGKVEILRTERYYLIVNGVRTLFDKIITHWSYNDHLIIVWPQPPSLGIAWFDNDINTHGFYDYNAGGPEEALKMAQRDGGKDFYYPEWLQQMGVNKTQDVQDATDRFYAYYLGEGDVGGTLSIPPVPYSTPRGNAVKDVDGNIVLSFTAADANINRVYSPDGTFVDISYLFDKPHIYPVGILNSNTSSNIFDTTNISHETRYGARDENGELLTDQNGDVLTVE